MDGYRFGAAALLAPRLDSCIELGTVCVIRDDNEGFTKSGGSGVADIELRFERDKSPSRIVGRSLFTVVEGFLVITSDSLFSRFGGTPEGTLVGSDVGQIEGLVEVRQVDVRKDISDECRSRDWRWRFPEDAGAGWGWKQLSERHRDTMRSQWARFSGKESDARGDEIRTSLALFGGLSGVATDWSKFRALTVVPTFPLEPEACQPKHSGQLRNSDMINPFQSLTCVDTGNAANRVLTSEDELARSSLSPGRLLAAGITERGLAFAREDRRSGVAVGIAGVGAASSVPVLASSEGEA